MKRRTGVEPLKLAFFHLIQRHFADIVRFVAFCNIRVVHIIMKALNGFLITQKQMTLKDECEYIMLENFIGHVFRTLS